MRKIFGLLCFLLITILTTNLFAQSIEMRVLKRGIVGKLFVSDSLRGDDHEQTKVRYLGTLTSDNDQVYKIMSYCWIWNRGQRATSRILVYSSKNKYLGDYYVYIDELPIRISNNKLVFSILDHTTHKPMIYNVDFNKGIPKHIQIDDEMVFDDDVTLFSSGR